LQRNRGAKGTAARRPRSAFLVELLGVRLPGAVGFVVTHRPGLIKPGAICRSLFDRLLVVLIRRLPMVSAAHCFDVHTIEQHGQLRCIDRRM
jgi:hypothetical protein